jgi:nitrite reductase/ring-hydroxylating ferredoxin subunit
MEVRVCRLDELARDTITAREVERRRLALVRAGDEVFAFHDSCPHKGGPLCEGKLSLKRGELICPWHFFRFDLRTGVSVTNSALGARTFPVAVRDGEVYVTLQ